MVDWKTEKPTSEDVILAVVETKKGQEVFVCTIDNNEMLVDTEYGDDYGWDNTCVDRWCLLQEILDTYNPIEP